MLASPPRPSARAKAALARLELGSVAERVVAPPSAGGFGAAPCAVVAAARVDRAGVRLGQGAAGELFAEGLGEGHGDEQAHATLDTPFDLASVTKPFTALAAARLVRAQVLAWSTPLGELVAEARGTPSEGVSLELLLSHRAGLDGHRQLYRPLLTGEAVDRGAALREAACARREGCEGAAPPHGFASLYSDLGYLLAGEALSRAAGLPLDALVAREVSEPLGLGAACAATLRARDPSFDQRVAPTELVPFRGSAAVRGAVHDENAWALSGHGQSGHAGLFGTAGDVLDLGLFLLDVLAGRASDLLSADELAFLLRPRPSGSYVLGFDRRTGDAPSSGARLGERTFGHLGFTGTSLWVDPDAGFVGVLLTNRVHPTREHLAIRAARPATYDALFDALFEPMTEGPPPGR
jgi:CubicO group peptidase (beta-lactamase class C family)